jgi:hypothetical protein
MVGPLTMKEGSAMGSGLGRTRFVGCCLMVAACLVFFATNGALGEEKKTGAMDPQAVGAFKRMSHYLKNTKTLSFTTSGLREVAEASGIKVLSARTGIAVMQRPNRFYTQVLGDDGRKRQTWFDGETLSIAVSGVKGSQYAQIATPEGAKTIDGILDHLMDEYDYVLQLGDLFYSDVHASLEDALLSAVHLGRKLVGGRSCHHLSLEFAGADAQLWVQDGDDPVPCRWAFTLRDEPSEPLFVSSFDSWVSNPSVDPARFRFVAPVSATKVEMKDLLAQASAR